MIYAELSDGTKRALDRAKVTLSWVEAANPDGGDDQNVTREYTLADVKKLVLIEPTPFVKAGLMGGSDPAVAMTFVDMSDLAIEIPVPAEIADGLADGLKAVVADAREIAEAAKTIAHRGEVAVMQSMADIQRMFGVPAKKLNGQG